MTYIHEYILCDNNQKQRFVAEKSYTFGRKLSDYTLLIGLSCFSDQFHK